MYRQVLAVVGLVVMSALACVLWIGCAKKEVQHLEHATTTSEVEDSRVPTRPYGNVIHNDETGGQDVGFVKQGARPESRSDLTPHAPTGRTMGSYNSRVPSLPKLKKRQQPGNNAAPAAPPQPAAFLPGEELWIVERPLTRAAPPDDNGPGTGSMLLRRDGRNVPVPLKHTDVHGQISGYIATVDVTQKFHNPYDTKIEAIYVFPLPTNAAVNDFLIVIGERRIRGIIREREEARRIYQAARRQGHVAALLAQERPNIFKQAVANIEPGKEIDVNIKYFHTLAYRDGSYEWVFPMVVGPRFNPAGTTDGVGAVARDRPGSSGQSTEVAYLRPEERSGHDIGLRVDLDAGVELESVRCPTHAVAVERGGPSQAHIALSPNDAIPNRDFVLRYQVAGKTLKANFLTHKDERGGFFSLLVYPPAELQTLRRHPVEMVFVLDCSGSMSGQPIAKSKLAVERALQRLQPDDSFQIIRFSSSASQLGSSPLPATPENIRRGLEYVRSLQGGGGTRLIEGIRAALQFPHDPSRLRLVSFLTDGYIGNETEIFAAVHRDIGSARLFSFGIGSSVNRYLLEGLARMGRGAVAFVGLDEDAGKEVDRFYERVRHPALADLEIDWGELQVAEVFPHKPADLFVGRPLLVTGRFQGDAKTTIRVRGRAGGETLEIPIAADTTQGETHPGLPSVWARTHIARLMDRAVTGLPYDDALDSKTGIRELALKFNLVSAYTSFVAVDASRQTEGDHGVTVQVPVPVPAGVRYETTVK